MLKSFIADDSSQEGDADSYAPSLTSDSKSFKL